MATNTAAAMPSLSSSSSPPARNLSASEHRKIDLQSAADLAYIRAQVSRAAREKLDRALPPSALPTTTTTAATTSSLAGGVRDGGAAVEGEDELRTRVGELVDLYVERVMEGVRANVRVNGEEVDGGAAGTTAEDVEMGHGGSEDVELEPFDARLADRIRTLEARRETLTERVADLRREAPGAAARNFEAVYRADGDVYGEREGQHREEAARKMRETGGEIDLSGVEALQRWDEVQRTWEKGSEGLVGLKGGLGETRAKVERAMVAVEYVEGRG